MEEQWRDVVGYEGYYIVSNIGNVTGVDRFINMDDKRRKGMPWKGRPPKVYTDERGYKYVILNKNGTHSKKRIHRLVAEAFIPNPDGCPQVNHKDEDKTNNAVENLEWCSAKYNSNYGTKTERARKTLAKRMSVDYSYKAVMGTNIFDGTEIVFGPLTNAEKAGFFISNINKNIRGEISQYKGYVWEEVDPRHFF